MKPAYENIYLGNFIFVLGFYAAKTREKLSNKSVQLVQQTPDEQKLNDLFVNWGGKNYIFEFKRNTSKILSELTKPKKKLLNLALNSTENNKIAEISQKSHFMAFGLSEGMGFIEYLKIHKEIERYYPLDKFCSYLVSHDCDLGMDYEELIIYLEFIAKTTESTTDGCGGFILNISDDNTINMVPFETVEVLAQHIDSKPAPQAPTYTRSFSP